MVLPWTLLSIKPNKCVQDFLKVWFLYWQHQHRTCQKELLGPYPKSSFRYHLGIYIKYTLLFVLTPVTVPLLKLFLDFLIWNCFRNPLITAMYVNTHKYIDTPAFQSLSNSLSTVSHILALFKDKLNIQQMKICHLKTEEYAVKTWSKKI